MRGKPARTVDDMQAQFDVAEYVLTSKAGLTHRDIHGEDRSGYHVTRRHDIAAATRRVLSRVGRRRSAASIATAGMTIGVTALLAGFTEPGVFVAGVAGVLAAAFDRYAPDCLFEAPAPVATVTRSASDGMTQREMNRRLFLHSKREELKEEKIEKRRKRNRRKQKTRPGP